MKIVIDLQPAQASTREGRVGQYTLALAQAMARRCGEHEIVIALNASFTDTIEPLRAAFDGLVSPAQIRLWSVPTPVRADVPANAWRHRAAQILRETFLAGLAPDVVLIPGIFEGFRDEVVHSIGLTEHRVRTAVVWHDLLPHVDSTAYLHPDLAFNAFYARQLQFAKRADFFLTNSESTRAEAIKYLGLPAAQCANTSAAVGAAFSLGKPGLTEHFQQKFGITRPMIVAGGADDGSENYLRLLKAFSALPRDLRERFQLVIAGPMHDSTQRKLAEYVSLFGLSATDVVFTSHTTKGEWLQMYRSCVLFIQPAWHEGFAYSTLEAMACAAAVIGGRDSSVAEVIGNSDALFDPRDVQAITTKLATVLASTEKRKAMAQRSQERAREFSWNVAADNAIGALTRWHDRSGRGGDGNYARESRHRSLPTTPELAEEAIMHALCVDAAEPPNQEDSVRVARAISRNHPPMRAPILAIDVSQLVVQTSQNGIQRVVRCLAAELLAAPPSGFVVRLVYADTERAGYRFASALAVIPSKAEGGIQQGERVDLQYGDVFLGLDLNHRVACAQQPFYDQIHRSGVTTYFVVYDLLPLTLPHAFQSDVAELHQKWLRIIAKSDGLIAISKSVADEVLVWLNESGCQRLKPLKLGWFHLGAEVGRAKDAGVLTSDANATLTAIRAHPAYLMVGTLEGRKGHLQALMAFETLWASGVNVSLVIVGKYGWNVEPLIELLRTHPERNKRLFWLEGISDAYLAEVYRASAYLLAASEGEGFGLPLIEAAQNDLPVLARDIPVFREVAGDAAEYFENSANPEAIAAAVRRLPANGAASAKRGRIHALSWRESCELFYAVAFGGKWSRTWMPGDSFRADGSDARLNSIAGQRIGREIVSAGNAGCLLYGPYAALAKGDYRVAIVGTREGVAKDGELLELVWNDGSGHEQKQPLESSRNRALLAEQIVSFANDVTDVQVRVWATAAASIVISKVWIDRLTEARV